MALNVLSTVMHFLGLLDSLNPYIREGPITQGEGRDKWTVSAEKEVLRKKNIVLLGLWSLPYTIFLKQLFLFLKKRL